MPEPVLRSGRYMPGLDGLRAIAVLAVIAYHLNFGWASGGLLGTGFGVTATPQGDTIVLRQSNGH